MTQSTIDDTLTECGFNALVVGAEPQLVELALRKLRITMNGSDNLRRVMIRDQTVAVLSGLGFSRPQKMVDAALVAGQEYARR